MKKYACILLFYPALIFGQTFSLEKEEQEMRKNAIDGYVDKQSADLNGDGAEDFVYTYAVSDFSTLRVYLQSDGKYVRPLETLCLSYSLEAADGGQRLQIMNGECCGENPFTLWRTYTFGTGKAQLVENYVATDIDYTGNRQSLPLSTTANPYQATTLNDGYNLRFSPDMEAFEDSDPDNFMFTCLPKTNIIATLKAGTVLKVLSEQISGERTWLYVEAAEKDLKSKCDLNFDFLENHPTPAVRGWVSGRYTEKVSPAL
jgi:hypothetical protein